MDENTWSLRSIGYTENYFSEKGGFSFKIRCADETQRAPYDYTVYLCNIDIADYSAEKFPDLENPYGRRNQAGGL